MGKLAIGIDLGTSTSEIAVYRDGDANLILDPFTKSPIVPSLVAMDRRGRWRIGEEARPFVDLPDHGVREVKRLMGTDQTLTIKSVKYRPEEISALILEKLKLNAETTLGTEVTEVVISVPANFPNAAREATLNAGEIAGLKVLRVINEPTAASLAFGIKHLDSEGQLVVFDFGGGTLDISLLEMIEGVLDVRASFGNHQLGGKDMDEAMMRLIWSKFFEVYPNSDVVIAAQEELKQVAERAKVELSTHHHTEVHIRNFARYKGEIIDLEMEISRMEFEKAIAPLLQSARECIQQALRAGKIRPDAIDTVILVGGTTYIPAVRQLVAEEFGREPSFRVNPDTAVAMGAAIAAAMELGLVDVQKGLVYTDSVPYGLGVLVLDEEGGRLFAAYSPLIEPNTSIPYTTKKVYSLLHPDQREVEIHLFQDHYGTARRIEDAIDTGVSGRIVDIPPALYGMPHPVEVEFSYDHNGIACIRASIPGLNKSVEIVYDHNATRISESELVASREKVRQIIEEVESIWKDHAPGSLLEPWRYHPKAADYAPIIERAERLLHSHPEYSDKLTYLVNKLKESLITNDLNSAEQACDELAQLLVDIQDD